MNMLSALRYYALASVCIFSASPLVYAIQIGLALNEQRAVGIQLGYFALVACFIPIFVSVGKLLYRACRHVVGIASVRLQVSSNARTSSDPKLSLVATVMAGLTLTQALGQIGRWFFVSAPITLLLADFKDILLVFVLHCFVTPILESAILAALVEIARKWLPNLVLITGAGIIFGIMHGASHYYWFLPAAALFSYSAAVYLSERPYGGRARAMLLISAVHVINNCFGLALIVGREFAIK